MKKKPSLFDMETALKQSMPTPPEGQKEAILRAAEGTAQDLPEAAPTFVRKVRRPRWQLVSACCLVALMLVGTGAWFGRDTLFGGTRKEAADEVTVLTNGFFDLFRKPDADAEKNPSATMAAPSSPTVDATYAADEDSAGISTTAAMTSVALGHVPGLEPIAPTDGPFGAETEVATAAPVSPADTAPPEIVSPAAGLLTAGEWCDNKDYEFFTNLFTDERWAYFVELYGLAPVERYVATVTNANGEPARSVRVTLTDADGNALASAVTDYTGTAYLFAMNETIAERAAYLTAEAVNGLGAPITETKQGLGASLVLPAEKPTVLDLMFVIDTTGSMWDELAYLQAELADVVARVKAENPHMTVRLSFNFYRDEGDAYVVLPFEFTEDIDKALATLAEQWADAGGDNPEAVHTALENALFDHEWSEHSVKLLYFVLDAPPHTEDPAVLTSLRQTLPHCAAEGIRIIPVASSGVDSGCEYFLRTCATLTGGTYTFLTDHSGIGGGHAEPMIGQYAVRPLNDLLVEITTRYCK